MRTFLSKVVALMLVAVLFVSGCASTPGTERLTGKYAEDAQIVVDVLRESLAVPADAENIQDVRADALSVMEAFASRYSRNKYRSFRSYTTLRTIFNTVGSNYRMSRVRPLRQDKIDRALSELRQAELAAQRGS